MNNYDVLFAVILRFEDTDIDTLDKNVEEYSHILGDCINEKFNDCFVAPIAMNEAVDDIFTVLKNFKIIGDEE